MIGLDILYFLRKRADSQAKANEKYLKKDNIKYNFVIFCNTTIAYI